MILMLGKKGEKSRILFKTHIIVRGTEESFCLLYGDKISVVWLL